jgi:phospholipase C
MSASQVQHVFVLMLENRSFDHLLGFSGITGKDAVTGAPTAINGLRGSEANSFNGKEGKVSQPADDAAAVDPGHEFPDVLCQLCGPQAAYAPGGAYPPIDNSGYMASYAGVSAKANPPRDPAEILKCFSFAQLPVLNALAREFAVCDNWHASMPGPTWPNRMFVHAASSAGLDHSPTTGEIVLWEAGAGFGGGFTFPNGDIFDRIAAKGLTQKFYAGDLFPMMAALKNVGLRDIRQYSNFAGDLQGAWPHSYTFIEPSYNLTQDYRGSTSQHPLGDVRLGEGLIKSTYEAIRNSAVWPNSLLIITWDEHGGFFDHAIPPSAVAPGDTMPRAGNSKFGFTFEQYGPRVPAVIVSPLIAQNTIDHRLYDHASVPATLEALFGLEPLTKRDRAANNVLSLVSLAAPRDTPAHLPDPAPPLAGASARAAIAEGAAAAGAVARPHDSVNDGNLPVVIQAAMRQDLEISPAAERPNILARVAGLRTRRDAAAYLREVAAKRGRVAPAATM